MIAIVDYGMSNLQSVRHAFEHLGAAAQIIDSPDALADARAVVLPGDGAFGPAMTNLYARGWIEPLTAAIAQGMPFLGICLGMQLLFETSEEGGGFQGLGILRGRVVRFAQAAGKVPQIGWNQLRVNPASRFLKGVPDGAFAYFVHSYYCAPDDARVIAAETEYGQTYASVVEAGKVWGAQFHPEKSSDHGLQMLSNFAALAQEANPTAYSIPQGDRKK